MDCDSASPYLDAFVDGEIDPDVERALEEHLRTCTDCQSAVWEIREFRSLFRMSAPRFKAPLELRLRVLNITQRVRAKPSVPKRYAWMAAAAVLVFGAMAVFLVSAPDH